MNHFRMRLQLLLILMLVFQSMIAQGLEPVADQALISKVVENYIVGWRHGDVELLSQVFALQEGRVLWIRKEADDEQLNSMTFQEILEKRKPQPEYGKEWKILSSEVINGKLAYSKVFISRKGGHYIDLLVLQKLNGQWRIVTKTFVTYTD